MRCMKDLQANKQNGISVMIPRGSGKRLAVITEALRLAKEGKRVAIFDIGGQNKVLEPMGEGNVLLMAERRL